MSEFRTKLVVEVSEAGGKFHLVTPLIYHSDLLDSNVIVPAKFETDFASIPRIFHSFVEVNGKHRAAAVVHDYLCVYREQEMVSQRQADMVFLEAMEVLGVRWSQRRVLYMAVRVYQSITGIFK
jgi:hypothetical protein